MGTHPVLHHSPHSGALPRSLQVITWLRSEPCASAVGKCYPNDCFFYCIVSIPTIRHGYCWLLVSVHYIPHGLEPGIILVLRRVYYETLRPLYKIYRDLDVLERKTGIHPPSFQILIMIAPMADSPTLSPRLSLNNTAVSSRQSLRSKWGSEQARSDAPDVFQTPGEVRIKYLAEVILAFLF